MFLIEGKGCGEVGWGERKRWGDDGVRMMSCEVVIEELKGVLKRVFWV